MTSKKETTKKSILDKFKDKQKRKRQQLIAKFELRKLSRNSKPQKVLIIRDEGKIVSLVKQTDLRKRGLTKDQALKEFIRKNSFNPDIKTKTTFSNKFTQTISTKRINSIKRTQIGCDILIRKGRGKPHKFTGYSDLGNLGDEGRKQSLSRALVGASNAGIIKYKDIPKLVNEVDGEYFFIGFNFLSEEKESEIANS